MRFFEEGELKLLWPLYFGNFITCLMYFIPAFSIIYFMNIGFSISQAGLLLAATSLGAILFEIPTGAIADKYGRKFSVILGAFLEAFCLFLVFFSTNFYFLAIVFFIYGVVGTLHSGSGESWIYDLITERNKKILKGYYSHVQISGSIGLVLSGIVGAFVVLNLGLSSIWIFAGLASVIYAFFLMQIEEIYTIKKEHENGLKLIWRQSIDSIKYSFSHKVLFYMFLAAFIVVFSVTFAESLAFTPYLKGLGFPDYAFGYLSSGIFLVTALAPIVTKYIKTKNREIPMLVKFTLVGSLILALCFFANSYLLALLIIFSSFFFFSMKYPIERPYLQRFIPTNKRATILSVYSMIYSLAGIIALPLGGFLIDMFGARVVILISAILGIPVALSYWKVIK